MCTRLTNRAVAKVARLIILTDPPQRGMRAHPVSWNETRQEYSRNYGRGHRLTPTQGKSPARANTASGAAMVNGLIRLQALYMKTHTHRKDSAVLTDWISLPYKLNSPLFSPTWGNPRQARGSPKLLGLIRKAHRELKGMISSYSQFFRQVRSGWD